MRTVQAAKQRRERLGLAEPRRVKSKVRAKLRKRARRANSAIYWTKDRIDQALSDTAANNLRIADDPRDKTNWGHGKMQRAGVYATRKRT